MKTCVCIAVCYTYLLYSSLIKRQRILNPGVQHDQQYNSLWSAATFPFVVYDGQSTVRGDSQQNNNNNNNSVNHSRRSLIVVIVLLVFVVSDARPALYCTFMSLSWTSLTDINGLAWHT